MSTNYIVVADEGLIRLLQSMQTYMNGLKICLFVNNVTPTHSSAADASWATEASFPGYARVTLAYANPVTNSNAPDADATPALATFTCTGTVGGGGQTIYGWYVVDPADGKWIYASLTNRSPAQVIENPGDSYQIQARFTGGVLASYP